MYLMSAYAAQARLLLAQHIMVDKANEIMAIPGILALLEIACAMVTVDAIGSQIAISEDITEPGAGYVLALKKNPPQWHADVMLWLDKEIAQGRLPLQESSDSGHGCLAFRRYALRLVTAADRMARIADS